MFEKDVGTVSCEESSGTARLMLMWEKDVGNMNASC